MGVCSEKSSASPEYVYYSQYCSKKYRLETQALVMCFRIGECRSCVIILSSPFRDWLRCYQMSLNRWKVAWREQKLINSTEPGGYLQWGDPHLSPKYFKVIQSFPMAQKEEIDAGISLVQAWAQYLDRDLNSCSKLPDIFQKCGLENVLHDFTNTDNDPSMRQEVTAELCHASENLIISWARMLQAESSGRIVRSHSSVLENDDLGLTVERAREVRMGYVERSREQEGTYKAGLECSGWEKAKDLKNKLCSRRVFSAVASN